MRSKLCAQSFAVLLQFHCFLTLTVISSMPHVFVYIDSQAQNDTYLDVVQYYCTIKLNPDAVKLKGILTQT